MQGVLPGFHASLRLCFEGLAFLQPWPVAEAYISPPPHQAGILNPSLRLSLLVACTETLTLRPSVPKPSLKVGAPKSEILQLFDPHPVLLSDDRLYQHLQALQPYALNPNRAPVPFYPLMPPFEGLIRGTSTLA